MRFGRLGVVSAAAVFVGLVGAPTVLGQAAPEFEDVPEGHVAEEAIGWAAENGITVGVGGNRFGVGGTLSRYEMVTFLCRAFDPGSCNSGVRGSDSFDDVPSGHWADYSVGWAVNLRVTAGVSATEFGGDQTLTREQMITFLYRAEGSPTGGPDGSDVFQDGPERSHWASMPIGWAYNEGVTGGIASDIFGFGTNVSREEVVLFLCRTVAPDTCQPSQQPLASSVDLIPRPEPDPAAPQLLLFTTGSNELRVWASDGSDPITIVDKNFHKDLIHNPRLSPDGKTISYSLQETLELWVVSLDGSNRTKVSDLSHHYRWSPDGRRLWYVDVSTGALWVVDADGSNNTRLADKVEGYSYARNPGWATWSPDGSRIAYEGRDDGGYNRQLWVVDVDGFNNKKLADETDRYMRWSPDGSRIAYTTNSAGELWIVDVDGSNNRKLADMNLASEIWRGALELRRIYYWAPDGSSIVYTGRVDTERWDELWRVDVDSSNSTKLADYVRSWYPYNSHIAYLLFGGELWVVDVDGSNNTKLDDEVRWPPGLAWSPSGNHIVYLKDDWDKSDDRITNGLWIVDSDGSNREKLVEGLGFMAIGWSPDESHVAYQSDRDESPLGLRTSDLWLVNVDDLTTLKLVDDMSYYSWSPDGSLVAYVATYIDGDNYDVQIWVQDVANHNKRLVIGDSGGQYVWVSAHCYGSHQVYPFTGLCYRGQT